MKQKKAALKAHALAKKIKEAKAASATDYGKEVQCVAVCCSVLQRVVVCCSVLQCVAVCCSVLQRVVVCCSVLQCIAVF